MADEVSRVRAFISRLPRIYFAPGAGVMTGVFVLSLIHGTVAFSTADDFVLAADVWSSAVFAAFVTGWIFLRIEGRSLRDLPRGARWIVMLFAILAAWVVVGRVSDDFLRNGFSDAFYTSAFLLSVPLAQGIFFGFLMGTLPAHKHRSAS